MNLNTANLAIKVAMEKANEVTKAKFCIAVLDAGVNLVAFSRMDGGRVGTIDVAMKKVNCALIPVRLCHAHALIQARTSALFEKESGMFGPMTQPGQPVYGLEHSNGGLITFPGGVPLR